MSLNIQIMSFFVSFIYGVLFEILLNFSSRILYSSKLFVKIIGSFLFSLFSSLLYFIILFKINYGVLHIYFFLCIILGYTLMCKVRAKFFCKV